MSYTAEHIDPEKFEAALDNYKRYQEELQRTAIETANARYEGYCKCLEDVRGMLHGSNYESPEKETAVYKQGANAAFYELCKVFGIWSQDIRGENISIGQKAYMVAERIKVALWAETPGKINWVSAGKAPDILGKHPGKEFVRVIVWCNFGVCEAVYDIKENVFRYGPVYCTEEVKGVTHWAIFERPKN